MADGWRLSCYTSSTCRPHYLEASARESGRKWPATPQSSVWARTSAFTEERSRSPTDSSTASARACHRHTHRRVGHHRRGFRSRLTGLRPVAEFQFMDFIGCAFNQIVNMVAKSHYRWELPPLVLRVQRRQLHVALPFAKSRDVVRTRSRSQVVCPQPPMTPRIDQIAIRDHNP